MRAALSVREWRILALLFLSGLLNYVDRSVLSVGATNIQLDLHLSNLELGRLLSAFFLTYAAFQLFMIAGWLVDRFEVGFVFAVGFFVWSGATAVTGMAATFAMVYSLRLLLGAGESIAYPAYSRILASQYPEHHRGFANALIDAGTRTGPAVGTLLGGLLMARYGWRPFFIALGLGSLLWLIPWFRWMPSGAFVSNGKSGATDVNPAPVPRIREILRQPAAWWSALGLFGSDYFWYFLVTWLPAYLEKERHFPKEKMAVFGSLSYLAAASTSLFAGWFADRLIARGRSATHVRKSFAGLGLAGATIILPVAVVRDERIAMIFLILACIAFGAYSSTTFAITQTLAGPRAAGKWTAFQNGFGNLAGVAAPWLTGWIVEHTGQFYLAFVVAAAAALLGAAVFVWGIGRIEPVRYREARECLPA